VRRTALMVAAVLGAVATLTGCSSDEDSLVLYNAQNSKLMEKLVEEFTGSTGIDVKIRQGGDSEMANQLATEGSRSPADVFTTENSTAMAQVDAANLFAPLPPSALEGVPAQHVSARKTWVGVAARSTVLVYNPSKLPAGQLPASMLDLSKPEWKGRFGYAPTGADFQAIASAVYAVAGDQGGDRFVQGLKDNGRTYGNNIAILKAVNAGEVPAGIIYHYYWYQDRADTGANSQNTELHFFGKKDAGAYLSVAGAGVLASSTKKDKAQRFVTFLASRKGQEVLAGSNDLQYAITNGVPSNPALKPLSELDPPVVRFDDLDGAKVLAAFRRVGIL